MVSYLPLLGGFDIPNMATILFSYRFGGTMVDCSGICALAGWGWQNKGSQQYCQVDNPLHSQLILNRSAAKTNGRDVPEHLLKAADLAVKEELEAEKEKGQSGASFLDLFRPTKIAVRTLNMCFQWFSATM